jgi:hypothetical protein
MRPLLTTLLLLLLTSCGDGVITTVGDACLVSGLAICAQGATCDMQHDTTDCLERFMAGCCVDDERCEDAAKPTRTQLELCAISLASLSCDQLKNLDLPASCIW